MRPVIAVVAIALLWFGGRAAYTHFFTHHDVNETHTLTTTLDLGISGGSGTIPLPQAAGSTVYVQCHWADTLVYIATNRKPENSALPFVFDVRAYELDSIPTGPFKESCSDWGDRHKLTLSPP